MWTYSSSNVCAAPQAAEKTVKVKTVSIIIGFRPKRSLRFDRIIRNPVVKASEGKEIGRKTA